MIVISKIMELQGQYKGLLEDHIVEILSVVKDSSTTEIIRRRALGLATELITPRNKSDVINFLISEISGLEIPADAGAAESNTSTYRDFIITRVRNVTSQYPDTIPQILESVLSKLLTVGGPAQKALESSAIESAQFVKEVLLETKD